MRTRKEIQALIEQVLKLVRADEARVNYWSNRELAARFGENAITQNLCTDEEGVQLHVANGRCHGSAVTNRLDAESLRELARRAESIAASVPEDPEAMPVLGDQQYPTPPPPRYDENFVALEPKVVAGQIAAAIAPVAARDWRASGLHTATIMQQAIGTSRGLFAEDRHSQVSVAVTVHGPAGGGAASGQATVAANLDVAALVREALADAEAAQNPQAIAPGDYTVIFTPDAVGGLLPFLLMDLDARAAAEGSSSLSGQLGQKIFHEDVNLVTDIMDAEIPGCAYGQDGLPARRTAWIDGGVLRRLFHTRYWAQQQGEEADAGMQPLIMSGGDGEIDDLVAGCGRGLLVKHLWYIRHVDRRQMLLTGMTRNGLFLVEDGKIVAPVKNLRFNESPLVFLRNVLGMSRPQCVHGSRLPAIMSADFTFSSGTESV